MKILEGFSLTNGILIMGAGPAGMAAALELDKAGKSVMIIEKSDSVGGLSKTFQYGEFRTDIGPHRFFSKNKYLYDMIADLLGEHWIKVDRLTRFYINSKFFLYPVDLKNALLNVGIYKASKIIFDYAYQKGKKNLIDKNPISFEEQIVSDFGRSLAELNMLNYTEKIWGLPCSEISPDWATQRIKGLSLLEVLKNSIFRSGNGPKTLVDQFFYPDTGTGLIYEKIRERLTNGKNNQTELILNSYPSMIFHNDEMVLDVILETRAGQRILKPEYIISSIPIMQLVKLLSPKAPDYVLQAADNLLIRSHVALFVKLNKSSVFPDQWIYFPDKDIPFGRIMEPRNFSNKLSPEGKTSLLIEFFCWKDDDIWKASEEELLDMSLPWLERMKFITKNDVMSTHVHKELYAYPVYDLNYKKNLKIIKDYLSKFRNLQCVGRAGSFRYNNQDHALEMGILAARNLIENKNYDVDKVGSEKQYFESGYVK